MSCTSDSRILQRWRAGETAFYNWSFALKKILIISDENEITKSFVTSLASQGCEVTVYGNALEALGEFEPHIYELVIVDIRLPRVNGFSVYRKLVQMDEEVNVCFLTNVEVRKSEFDILFPDLDVKFFLTKPLSVPALMKHLEHAQITTDKRELVSR
jgi:DNA-binding response OmpR family regulator